jgi:hypothetical protein
VEDRRKKCKNGKGKRGSKEVKGDGVGGVMKLRLELWVFCPLLLDDDNGKRRMR